MLGRSCFTVCQRIASLTPKYWWTIKFRIARISDHGKVLDFAQISSGI